MGTPTFDRPEPTDPDLLPSKDEPHTGRLGGAEGPYVSTKTMWSRRPLRSAGSATMQVIDNRRRSSSRNRGEARGARRARNDYHCMSDQMPTLTAQL